MTSGTGHVMMESSDSSVSSGSLSSFDEDSVNSPSDANSSAESGSETELRTKPDEESFCRKARFYISEDDPSQLLGLDVSEDKKVILGVCAMAKKSNSKPMKEILSRLDRFEHIQTLVFEESVILNEPVENWPIVDAFISFFSFGFPLEKAIAYENLRRPFVINDMDAQYTLQDRREVYKILTREGIQHPRYAMLSREGESKDTFVELEDSIEVNGVLFHKPFVEKPVSAEDHNVYIYFPAAAGGGSQRLFRKVGSRSSIYSPVNRTRKVGSYIYEDFMPTDGTDVKVYTVGTDYAHAEARKSPALDGKVERDKNGKEIRYPVLLSAREKLIAKKICLAFKQNVCGFDLLRASGKSYVCDVNGFSFVKNSTKYYDDCARVLGTMIMRALAPQLHIPMQMVLGAAPEDIPVVPTTSGSMMELRCVAAVIRHGDRTPKQKMKMEVKHKRFFELFEKYDGYKKGHLKLKKPKQLQEVLDIARDLLNESASGSDPELLEKKAKLRQLKLVLEMYGHFSGINRKVQLKYQPGGAPKKSSSEEDDLPREPSLVLIVKWGGELTPAGRIQAEDLGKAFRTLYPGGQGEFEMPGLGFLRLHSTFRHDLKIYASDEGRVQMTAAAFTKGLLALEGELTPILVQMVKSANTNGLLDKEGETSKYQHIVKERLLEIFNEDRDFTEEDYQQLIPTGIASMVNATKFIKNPRKMCEEVHNMLHVITTRIRALKMELKTRDLKLYHGESWELLIRRWAKLEKDFKMKNGYFDISKIPDIYDCIKYDLQHNQKTLQFENAEELFTVSKALADIVIPQEYGMALEEKLHISQSICTPLMRKIHSDLHQCIQPCEDDEYTRLNSEYSKGVSSPERFVRTRLYFTSESHIHSLLNMLRYGGLCDEMKDEQWMRAINYLNSVPELNYMTQIVIMMFEDPSKDLSSPERFHIELHFSPGAYTASDKDVVQFQGSGYRTKGKSNVASNTSQIPSELTTSKPSPKHREVVVAPAIAEELEEADIFESGRSAKKDVQLNQVDLKELKTFTISEESTQKSTVNIPQPRSPDPDVPEWDWGDSTTEQTADKPSVVAPVSGGTREFSQNEVISQTDVASDIKIPTAKSQPITIQMNSPSRERPKPVPTCGSYEEKRSRSLEDAEQKETGVRWIDWKALVERQYLTIQLPIKDRHRHSFSSLMFLNPNAFK
ncbi:hypothetical protein ACJMK2_025442, partial [Sinanodonta woodiana]